MSIHFNDLSSKKYYSDLNKYRKVSRSAHGFAFLSGISGFVLLLGLSVAQAQVVIDGGQIVTVPGS